ncbi:MAG: caspase family protein, partial [Armatimonadetes bacterium]|nr:caspase family protein [Armatimonadota bacterium]
MFLLTKESDPRSLVTLKASACTGNSITEVLDEVKANRVLVVYDACRSNPKADKAGGDNRMGDASRDLVVAAAPNEQQRAAQEDKVLATLFACSPGQRSYEWNEKQHGYFTWYLIEGLKGAAAQDGKVTLQSLVGFLRKSVKQAADEAGHEQMPWQQISGTSPDAFILSQGRVTVADVPP